MVEKNIDQMMGELDEARKQREKFGFEEKADQVIENLENNVLDDIFSVRIHLQRLRDQDLIEEADFYKKSDQLRDLISEIGPLYKIAFEQRLDLVLNTRKYFNEIFAYTPEVNKFVYDPVIWCENGWKLPRPQDLQKAVNEGYTKIVVIPRMMMFDYDRILKAMERYASNRFGCKNVKDEFLQHFKKSKLSLRPTHPYLLIFRGGTAFGAHTEYQGCDQKDIMSYLNEYQNQKNIFAAKGLKLQGLNLAEYLNFVFGRFVLQKTGKGNLDTNQIPFPERNSNAMPLLMDEYDGSKFGYCSWSDDDRKFEMGFTDKMGVDYWPRTAICFDQGEWK